MCQGGTMELLYWLSADSVRAHFLRPHTCCASQRCTIVSICSNDVLVGAVHLNRPRAIEVNSPTLALDRGPRSNHPRSRARWTGAANLRPKSFPVLRWMRDAQSSFPRRRDLWRE